MTTVVIMPGGFHPFHAGHLSLYNAAREAFPEADVYVAATNDTSTRPFPFAVKEKLARLAGVESGRFVQVKSPFRAEEITRRYNPETDQLIFVRSEKDANSQPRPGGVKRDGSPSYLQPYGADQELAPFAQHAYMAYLPTVEFGPGMTSATQIRTAWPTLNEKRKTALIMSLYPRTQGNVKLAQTVVKLLDAAIGTETVAEGKITLSTDPNWYGVEVGNYRASGPVVNIPANQLVGFEPDDKMNRPASRANVEKIVAGLKQGAKLPPLLVRKYKNGYQVLDGHHRFWAYKMMGVKSISAQIVPDDDIEEKGQRGVEETVAANHTTANTAGAGAGMTATYQQRENQPIAEDYLEERRSPQA